MSEIVPSITEEHIKGVLAPRALNPKEVGRLGVYSITSLDELPEEFRGSRYATVPALVFPWNSPTGGTVLQLRPDEPVANDDGDPVKYVFPAGTDMVLNRLKEPSAAGDAPVLLCEGTCQAIAASIYAPPGWAVYGLSGCWNWRKGETQVAIPDLIIMENREVVIALDADAAVNRNVYDAGLALKAALEAEGARPVRFLRLPGGKKAGLDDVLAARPEEKRASFLARLVENAGPKLADRPPAARRSADKAALTAKLSGMAAGGRPIITVNEDRHEVINAMTDVLVKRWDGDRLFDFGGVIAQRRAASLEPVTDGLFADLIAEAAVTVTTNAKGEAAYAWPDGPSMKAVLSARAGQFTRLERISRVPFVRPDGTICQEPGYDEMTQTFLVTDDAAAGIVVPDQPTTEDVAGAVKLLRDEWLGDLMESMPDPADKANTLALVLTPLIRGLVPLAPMAVVDGLQMGVGKNLLADVIAVFATGRPANPLPYSVDDEENRKVVTSSFRAGHELFVFDEAHVIQGRALARSITSQTYSDRVLGVSTMAEFPNRITWVALGNNVQVNGDMSRRVYRIRLAPAVANPQDRDVAGYRHPDLIGWTAEHRAELLAAGLTLVRAWFAGDRPVNLNGRRFGSFEAWGGMVGGILDNAGVPGFLETLREWREETDYETSYWSDHFRWLHGKFGSSIFTVPEVLATMRRSNHVEYPPRLEDHDVKGYGRELGKAYGRMKGRTLAGLTLVKVSETAGHGARWQLVSPTTDSDAGADSPSPSPSPSRVDQGGSGSSAPRKQRETSAYVSRMCENTAEGREATYPIYPNYPATDGDPLAHLLPLAMQVASPVCPDCDQPEEMVPGAHWYACPRCHPGAGV